MSRRVLTKEGPSGQIGECIELHEETNCPFLQFFFQAPASSILFCLGSAAAGMCIHFLEPSMHCIFHIEAFHIHMILWGKFVLIDLPQHVGESACAASISIGFGLLPRRPRQQPHLEVVALVVVVVVVVVIVVALLLLLQPRQQPHLLHQRPHPS